MFFSVKESKLKLQNMELDYISFGSGSKPLIMIQGLNTNGIAGAGMTLAYLYRIFAKTYTVYLFDRRPEVFDGITVEDMAGDVAEAMDALGLGNAHVIGVSQGGMIAQYLAIQRPDLVEKLVLAVTLSRMNDAVTSVIENWIDWMKQGKIREMVTDMAEKMYSADYVRRYRLFLPLLAILQKPKDPDRFVILARSCLTCDAYDQLHKIRCPVFVIGGRQDQVVGAEASEEIAEKLNCPIYLYDRLGHAAYEEAADFNQRIYDFLTSQ